MLKPSVRMTFTADMKYNTEVLYFAGKEYDVPANMVDRWIKRGGQIVSENMPKGEPTADSLVVNDIPKDKEKDKSRSASKSVNRGGRK